jgi:mono/diheme cytochrome c family protein
VLVSLSNPQQGQELFNTFFDQAGFMCATCHRVDSEERLIGPGQLNVGVRAGTPGHQSQPGVPEAPERYIYNSITDPNLVVLESYPANLMPQVYKDILSEQDIYDLIAYLMTLK